MSNLPPGVTDSMCEPHYSECANCGHSAEMHLEEKAQPCDQKGCDCEGYAEGEYEPDYE